MATPAPRIPLQPSQLMKGGAYRVVQPLSKGGMGAIYLVEDLGAFDRLRVIKEMLDYVELGDYPNQAAYQQAVQKAHIRFEDEARTLASLHHSGIPDIIAYFTENARNYIVMEYVEGQDLEQRLTHADDQGQVIPGKPCLPEEVCGWAIQICQVLEYLTRVQPQPVVHNDIKPANLILDKNSSQVRLVDFGTAKAKMVLQPGGTVGLQKSSVYGTVGYAPPEQYMARSEPRSDVYALAATIYHLLTDDDPRQQPGQFSHLMGLLPGIRDLLLQALDQDVTRRPTAEQMRHGLEALIAPPSRRARPFRFRSGAEVRTLSDLVVLCDTQWNDGLYHLYAGHLEPWLNDLGEAHLAIEAARIRLVGGNQSVGLESLLQATGLAAAPQPMVMPSPLDFGPVRQDESKTAAIQVSNAGRGFLSGQLQADVPWLSVSPSSLEGNSTTCLVIVSPFNLAPSQVYQGCLVVQGQGFRLPVPVTVEVNRPVKAARHLPRGLAFLLGLAVSALFAFVGWRIAEQRDLEVLYGFPWYLDPLRPEMIPLVLLVGSMTALGSTIADAARRQAVASRGGWRVWLDGLLAGTFFAALGTWLGVLLWHYVLGDSVLAINSLAERAGLLCQATLLGGAVLGAAYGTSGPGETVLENVLRFIVKLLLVIFWLVVAAVGGYVGYAVAQGNEWAEEGWLWAAVGAGALAAVLVVRALWRFIRDAINR